MLAGAVIGGDTASTAVPHNVETAVGSTRDFPLGRCVHQ